MVILFFLILTSPADYTARENQPSPVEKKVVESTGTIQNPDSVIAFIKTGLKTDSLNVMLHRRYQDARMRAEKDRSALVDDYEAFLETHPRSPAFLYLLGRIQTDTAKEKNYYQQAYKADSNNYWANYGRGAFPLLKEKNFEVAKNYLDRSIAIDNSIYLPFYLYANRYAEIGDHQLQEHFLTLALTCDPNNYELLQQLSTNTYTTKNYDLAVAWAKKNLTRKSELSSGNIIGIYRQLLDLFIGEKAFATAEAYADTIRTLDPSARIDLETVEIYSNKNLPDSVLRYLKQYAQKEAPRFTYALSDWLKKEYPAVMKDAKLVEYFKTIRKELGLDSPAKAIAGKTADGREISLPQFKGKVVLVDFWASWCGPCRGETPYLIGVYKKYHPKGLEIIGVNIDTDQAAMAGYLKENPDMVWPQIFSGKAWQDDNAVRYEVKAIPQIMLIDQKGIVREIDLRGEGIEIAVSKYLK